MHRRTDNPAPSTIRNRRNRARRLAKLLKQLGGRCQECGSRRHLTIDHIYGRDWDIRKVHSWKRLRIYEEEADAGKVQILCLSCNSRKGQPSADDGYFGPEE